MQLYFSQYTFKTADPKVTLTGLKGRCPKQWRAWFDRTTAPGHVNGTELRAPA